MRNTKIRSAVVACLKKSGKPLAVKDINVKADLVTLYRTLETLGKNSLVKKVFTANSSVARYEINTSDHHHLICDHCGKIEEIAGCNINTLAKKISKEKHWLINNHFLEFSGLCEYCQK